MIINSSPQNNISHHEVIALALSATVEINNRLRFAHKHRTLQASCGPLCDVQCLVIYSPNMEMYALTYRLISSLRSEMVQYLSLLPGVFVATPVTLSLQVHYTACWHL